jgi:hypothetical protein
VSSKSTTGAPTRAQNPSFLSGARVNPLHVGVAHKP